jgi:peptidoglycan/LPS O-acetylase OafA/YrhL
LGDLRTQLACPEARILRYRPEVDGLRALAVLPVIFFHAGFDLFSGGFVGVDIFFVISGYLITSIILTEVKAGTFSLLNFYERRARRILPALFLVVAACIPFAWLWLTPSHMREFTASVRYLAAFVSNIYFYKESGYFGPKAELEPLLHTWSLSVEEQYYVLYPLLVLTLWKYAPRALPFALLGFAVGSLTYANQEVVQDSYAAFFLLPSRFWELMLGSVLAFLVVQGTLKVKGNQAASLLGLCLILYAVFAFSNDTPTPSVYTLIPTVGAALILLCATAETRVGALLGSKAFVGLGLISYSAYLWHQPIFAFARHRNLADPSPPLMLTLVLLSLALAWLSWAYVEQPFRRRDWIKQMQVFVIASLLSAAFLTFGILGETAAGYAFRIPAHEKFERELQKADDERSILIKRDICHFNNKTTKLGLEKFLKQWNCKGSDSSGNLMSIPLIVTGDSHSADLVMALKLNGLNPLQLGGARCSLVPSKMSPDCKLIFDVLFNQVKDDGSYQYLALVNRFSEDELTVDAITEMLSYWEGFGKKLIFFVGMPNFPYFKETLTNGEQPVFDHKISELSKRPGIIQLLHDQGVYLVDREKVFCAINKCGFVSHDGSLLLTDGEHLSRTGALLFGQKLLSDDPLFHKLAGLAKGEATGSLANSQVSGGH